MQFELNYFTLLLCVVLFVLCWLFCIKLHKTDEHEKFALSSGGRKVHEGIGGSLISPIGLHNMYERQIIKPMLEPVGYNEYNKLLPNNQIDPTTFYRYYYLEKYSLSVLYIILQELENRFPNELIRKLAKNKIYIEQMSNINNIRTAQTQSISGLKVQQWKDVIEYMMKYIYSKYPHIDYPFVYNTTTVYVHNIPFEQENVKLNDEFEYDPEDENNTSRQIYLIQFDIKKNFHYLLTLKKSHAPDVLSLYIKFAIDEKKSAESSTTIPVILLSRIKEIYDAYVDKYYAFNDVDYIQYIDKPEQRLNFTEEQITEIVKEQHNVAEQSAKTQCKRITSENDLDEGTVIDVTNKIDCLIEGGVWDAPCVTNSDCPFYKANKNYPNEFGGCDPETGNCQIPSGLTKVGYRMFAKPEDMRLYNCTHGKCGEKTSGTCINDQIEKTKRGEMKSPDYIFLGDTPVRKKFADLLMSQDLKWCDY